MPLPRLSFIAALVLAVLGSSAFAQQPTPPILPDSKLTPGDTLDVTLVDIQEKGYSAKVRNVPISVKREVYASYGITHWNKGEYEIDHLVALSLGGSNSKKNLWPQSYLTEPWNAHTKDQLEYKLLKLVRAGTVDLHTAQQAMSKDWIAAYKQYVSPEPLANKHTKGKPAQFTGLAAGDQSAAEDEDPDVETGEGAATRKADAAEVPATVSSSADAPQVWVNTKSKVIWKAGSRYYGKTKEGKYMSEADALAAGYHAAK